jgi:hypothetical protein
MKRTLTTAAMLLGGALLWLPAAAQKSEAGLWEYRITLKSGSGRMEGAMRNWPRCRPSSAR